MQRLAPFSETLDVLNDSPLINDARAGKTVANENGADLIVTLGRGGREALRLAASRADKGLD